MLPRTRRQVLGAALAGAATGFGTGSLAQQLARGGGLIELPGGPGKELRRISVHYFRPDAFTPSSPVLLVVPGSGRNAETYLLPWIQTAQASGVLVAALGYPEADYDFADYQMAGVIRNLRLINPPLGPNGKLPDVVRMRDEDILLEFNDRRAEWLFHDFDRIFESLARMTGARREAYDIFGHSAGGQILHRLALFQPSVRAERIIAANAGFYTLPRTDVALPFGLGGTSLTAADLRPAFAKKLTLLLGELDNDPERGGQHVHTPIADQQGLDRLSRGRHFFEQGRAAARAAQTPFAWSLQVVRGVGHDHRGMAAAAARLLYG